MLIFRFVGDYRIGVCVLSVSVRASRIEVGVRFRISTIERTFIVGGVLLLTTRTKNVNLCVLVGKRGARESSRCLALVSE